MLLLDPIHITKMTKSLPMMKTHLMMAQCCRQERVPADFESQVARRSGKILASTKDKCKLIPVPSQNGER
jgi:hypothetical protein